MKPDARDYVARALAGLPERQRQREARREERKTRYALRRLPAGRVRRR